LSAFVVFRFSLSIWKVLKMSNAPKLSEVFTGRDSSTFTASGFVDKNGRFVPLVKVRGARHALSVAVIADIEREYDALIKTAIDALSPEHEARMRQELSKSEPAKQSEPAKRTSPLADRIASSAAKQ
jgi:hypothetical protein